MTSDLQRQLAARIQFYRELGIYDFYRREVPESDPQRLKPAVSGPLDGAVETAPFRKMIDDKHALPTTKDQRPTTEDLLRVIQQELGDDCTRCRLHKGRTHVVFGTGNARAELMFVGEGPGADEDQQGLPFVGRAGQLLNNMIAAMGLRREDVYIANVVKCRPPGNRTPERDECDTCGPFLMRQIAAIQPKVMVALGATAAKYLLGLNDSMANLRGRFYDFMPASGSAPVKLAVTYHPAYLLRDPRQKAEAWKDLQMVMGELGLKPPKKS